MTTMNGTLVHSDPLNPTRTGRFRDDYFLVVSPGQVVQVDLTSPTSGNNIDPYLQLINPDTGDVIAFDDDSGLDLNSQLTFTVQQGVNYVLRATSFSAADTGRYRLITNVGNIARGGTPITGDQTLNGTLVHSDPLNPTRTGRFRDDYFLTGVSSGQVVQVDLTSPTSGNNIDPYLQLINANTGDVIAFDDDSGLGLNSQLTFTVQQGVDYVLRATSFSEADVGTYTLMTSTSSFSVNGTLADTDPLNPTRTGRFRDDYFLTGANPGQQVQLNLNSPSGLENFDTYVQLVNADTGAVIAFDDDSGLDLNSQLTFTVQQGVDYIVRTTSFSPGVTGDYSLTSSVGVLYEGVPVSPGPNEIIVGTLDETDLNNDLRNGSFYDGYYLNDLIPGQPVQLNLNSPSGSENFDTYLQLANGSTGDLIAFDDDGGLGLNSQLTFTPQQGVEYIARVTSFASGATGDYTLTFG